MEEQIIVPEAKNKTGTAKDRRNAVIILLVVFILILLVIIGVGGFMFLNIKNEDREDEVQNESTTTTTTLKNEYSGWQTCNNEEWGVSVKHPSDWMCEINTDEYHAVTNYDIHLGNDLGDEIYIADNATTSPIQGEYESTCQNKVLVTTLFYHNESHEINYCYNMDPSPEIFTQVVYDSSKVPNQQFFIVGYFVEDPNDEEFDSLKKIFDSIEIVSSKETSDVYDGWLTYTNDEYGISFKYPPDFSVTFNQGGLTVRGSDKDHNTYSISVFKGERKTETDSIKEFYLKEGEEDIYVGDTKYTAEILYSAEGMQAPGKPDFMNSIVWTTKYIEINSNTSIHINLMEDNY